MRAIDKFIIHVTHNLFSLNEYSEGEINRLMAQFKDEADDLNIQITDTQLKAYIERFDALKNSPKVTEKDLRKYSLSKLIKLFLEQYNSLNDCGKLSKLIKLLLEQYNSINDCGKLSKLVKLLLSFPKLSFKISPKLSF